MQKKYKNLLWRLTIEDYLKIVEIAKSNGLQPGDSMEKYFLEYIKENKVTPIGATNKDVDALTGELREKGKKVINLKEIQRRKDNLEN